jgi:hypothetical protein
MCTRNYCVCLALAGLGGGVSGLAPLVSVAAELFVACVLTLRLLGFQWDGSRPADGHRRFISGGWEDPDGKR